MGKSLAKVVYKPDPNASDVFLVVVNPVEVCISATATESSAHTASVSIRNGRMEVIILALHYRLNH